MSEDGFLSRWSRRKAGAKAGRPAPPEPQAQPAPPAAVAGGLPPAATGREPGIAGATSPGPADADAAAANAAEAIAAQATPEAPPAPTLEDVAALLPGDEISRFVARGVDEDVKRAALKKLFSDPHYNIMDGLDIYIDDYSKPDPIPLAMLRQMNQSKVLGLFADEEVQNAPAAQSPPPADAPAAEAATDLESSPPVPTPDAEPATATAALPPTIDEDADLQLQPDDAARRPGAEEGAGTGRG